MGILDAPSPSRSEATNNLATKLDVTSAAGAFSLPGATPKNNGPRQRSTSTATVTAGTSMSLNLPAGSVAGDVVVAALRTDNLLPTTPAGWVLKGQQTFASGTAKVAVYYRIVSISEPVSTGFTFSGATTAAMHAISFTNADINNPLPSVGFGVVSPASTTFTAPAITLAKYGFQVAFIVGETNGSLTASTPSGGWSKRIDGSSISTIYRQYANSLNSGTQDFTRNGTDTGIAINVAVASIPVLTFANSFESGDLNGWTYSTQNGPVAPAVITDPFSGLSTRKLGQFDVVSGQTRQELITGGTGQSSGDFMRWADGDELYFATAYWLAPDFIVGGNNSWILAHQWMCPPLTGTETANLGLAPGFWNTDYWCMSTVGFPGGGSTEAHRLIPITRGQWTRFIFRIKFSTDPTLAKVQAWAGVERAPLTMVFDSDNKQAETINGISVETRKGWWPSYSGETAGSQGGTMRTGCIGGYEKHGIYRDSSKTGDTRFYSTGVRWGRSLAEVLG